MSEISKKDRFTVPAVICLICNVLLFIHLCGAAGLHTPAGGYAQQLRTVVWRLCRIACQWEEKAKDLAGRFIKNFAKFTGNEAGKALVAAGPKL